jgi:hypothetical protein
MTDASDILYGTLRPREHVTLEKYVEIACGHAELEGATTLADSLRLVEEYSEYAGTTAVESRSGEWPAVAAQFETAAEQLRSLSERGYEQRGAWKRTSSNAWWAFFETRAPRVSRG